MALHALPPLPLAEWEATRNTLQRWVKVLSVIRGSLSPKQKHWWHDSLRVSVTGIETPPIPAPADSDVLRFAVNLNLAAMRVELSAGNGFFSAAPFRPWSAARFFELIRNGLTSQGIDLQIDDDAVKSAEPGELDPAHVQRYWTVLSHIDLLFNEFKAGLREESGPVRFWSDHFDLALLWFSGRKVPGQDPANAEYADEQMNFGFSTGDEVIPEPYFYITAYPLPEKLPEITLPDGAYWHTEGWQGAVLPYASVADSPDFRRAVLEFLQTVHGEARKLMLG